jgi:hypothetical protein
VKGRDLCRAWEWVRGACNFEEYYKCGRIQRRVELFAHNSDAHPPTHTNTHTHTHTHTHTQRQTYLQNQPLSGGPHCATTCVRISFPVDRRAIWQHKHTSIHTGIHAIRRNPHHTTPRLPAHIIPDRQQPTHSMHVLSGGKAAVQRPLRQGDVSGEVPAGLPTPSVTLSDGRAAQPAPKDTSS